MSKRLAVALVAVALSATIVTLDVWPSLSQGPGGGKKGGKGGFQMDPSQIFDFMTKRSGKDYIEIKSAFKGREEMELFAKQSGITDGKLTRDQYLKYFEKREQLREEVAKTRGSGGSTDGKGPPPGGGSSDKGKGPGGFDPEAFFKRYDANGDGFLNASEIGQTRRFKEEWQKWDANKDSMISLDEWKSYMNAMMEQRNQQGKDGKGNDRRDGDGKRDRNSPGARIEVDDLEENKVVVYRAGKLPKELPSWFDEYDTNKDGQVSLMEWLKAGKTPAEYLKMDRNDDGLLTAEEVLRHQSPTQTAAAVSEEGYILLKENNDNDVMVASEGGNGKGGFGKDRKGRGGFGPGSFGQGSGGFGQGPGGFGQGPGGFGKGSFGKGSFGKGSFGQGPGGFGQGSGGFGRGPGGFGQGPGGFGQQDGGGMRGKKGKRGG
ncbi:MAG: hypothetical protein IT429_19445 [Gemmataceae bacterium]|nr:hypothetical protein [Gemmataceae bacterium]